MGDVIKARELKFRWYDKANKEYVYFSPFDEDMIETLKQANEWTKKLSSAQQLWEQYTGLKDVNGRDIYEGDLLACRDVHDGRPQEVMFLNGEYTVRSVPYDDDWERLKSMVRGGISGYESDVDYDGGAEVIGNINETPELLGIK